MRNLHIIALLAIFAIIFILIGHKYRNEVQLALKQELFVIPKTIIDWWSVSHFMLFFLFGMLEPGHHAKFFMIGAAFEMFEDILSSDKSTQLINCSDPMNKNHSNPLISKVYCNGLQDDYWYAKWDDMIVNIMGYMLGSSIQSSGIYDINKLIYR